MDRLIRYAMVACKPIRCAMDRSCDGRPTESAKREDYRKGPPAAIAFRTALSAAAMSRKLWSSARGAVGGAPPQPEPRSDRVLKACLKAKCARRPPFDDFANRSRSAFVPAIFLRSPPAPQPRSPIFPTCYAAKPRTTSPRLVLISPRMSHPRAPQTPPPSHRPFLARKRTQLEANFPRLVPLSSCPASRTKKTLQLIVYKEQTNPRAGPWRPPPSSRRSQKPETKKFRTNPICTSRRPENKRNRAKRNRVHNASDDRCLQTTGLGCASSQDRAAPPAALRRCRASNLCCGGDPSPQPRHRPFSLLPHLPRRTPSGHSTRQRPRPRTTRRRGLESRPAALRFRPRSFRRLQSLSRTARLSCPLKLRVTDRGPRPARSVLKSIR